MCYTSWSLYKLVTKWEVPDHNFTHSIRIMGQYLPTSGCHFFNIYKISNSFLNVYISALDSHDHDLRISLGSQEHHRYCSSNRSVPVTRQPKGVQASPCYVLNLEIFLLQDRLRLSPWGVSGLLPCYFTHSWREKKWIHTFSNGNRQQMNVISTTEIRTRLSDSTVLANIHAYILNSKRN